MQINIKKRIIRTCATQRKIVPYKQLSCEIVNVNLMVYIDVLVILSVLSSNFGS